MTYLTITRREDERYYLIVKQSLEPGTVIKIVQGDISSEKRKGRGKPTYRGKSKQNISAPPEIAILREELVEKLGGLEEVLKQIRAGKKIIDREKI